MLCGCLYLLMHITLVKLARAVSLTTTSMQGQYVSLKFCLACPAPHVLFRVLGWESARGRRPCWWRRGPVGLRAPLVCCTAPPAAPGVPRLLPVSLQGLPRPMTSGAPHATPGGNAKLVYSRARTAAPRDPPRPNLGRGTARHGPGRPQWRSGGSGQGEGNHREKLKKPAVLRSTLLYFTLFSVPARPAGPSKRLISVVPVYFGRRRH